VNLPRPLAVADEVDWILCSSCGGPIYRKQLLRNLQVCPECGAHLRLTAHDRIEQLLDPGSAELLRPVVHDSDPLDFVDTKPYRDRLLAARESTGLDEAVVLARGTIDGNPVVAAVMDFRFLGGSLGSAVGDLITVAAETALAEHTPLLLVTASGGARMQEGVLSLMQMAKTSQALGRLDEAGVLTISLITDPTYGGVAASFATLADVILAEPKARMGFAGPRVIEQTIKQSLPPGFQTAEFLLAHGLIDAIRPRAALRATLARLLSLGDRRPSLPAADDSDAVIRDYCGLAEADAWQTVQQARDIERPTTLDYLSRAFDDFEEWHGDRLGGDCAAIVGGTARLDGVAVMVIGHQKGRTIAELTFRNYGMPTPDGYRKAARLMRTAAKLGLPVITFVDTPGAFPGIEAEEQGQAIAIAENIRLMTTLPVPVITLVTGEGGSGGALGLAVANEVLICSNGVYSVISPEGCAAILWNDPAMAPAAAAALGIDARQLLRMGVVDGVVLEPGGGSQADHSLAADRVRTALAETLHRLSVMDGPALVESRRARFRSFGTVEVAADEHEKTETAITHVSAERFYAHVCDPIDIVSRGTNAGELSELLDQTCRNAVQLLSDFDTPPQTLRVQAGDVTVEANWPGTPHEGRLGPAATPVAIGPALDDVDPDALYLTAPAVGVFYPAPEPGAEPFVKVGDVVIIGQQVAIIEAMKLMIPLQADQAGRIVEVLKANADRVEYGERVFALAEAEAGAEADEG
jgi:acetyl-CoA carboxylase carboxyl transferase beta subunit/acetyl-CoA carboxylase carboxyl transferase alpha subunit